VRERIGQQVHRASVEEQIRGAVFVGDLDRTPELVDEIVE